MNIIEFGDCREIMRRWASEGIKAQTCVTSPPYYGLRDYGHEGQIGLEETPEEYIAAMVEVFRCVRDVLADDGTLWLNIGDSYARQAGNEESKYATKHTLSTGQRALYDNNIIPAKKNKPPPGLKPKDLIGIPWMLAFALRADGWYLRQDIIWHKPNPMPESVQDRCTKAHEYIFLLSKSQKYYFDYESIKVEASQATIDRNEYGFNGAFKGQFLGSPIEKRWQNGRPIENPQFSKDGKANKRSVWTVTTKPYEGAHFAVFPPDLIEPCVLAGAPVGGIVLDPFMGSGTTAQVAQHLGRKYLGCELNPEYQELQHKRLRQQSLELA
jgi:DNA modification methylase